jgi:NAD(P)-dependent dehydrogenase (short-subunit alcohol dehydrogenase family)
MGLATARELVRLGAEVHGIDIRQPELGLASFRIVDLRDAKSIEDAVAAIGGEIQGVFNCAGIPNNIANPVDVMKVNFIGTRHWTERWIPRMTPGGAIVSVASTSGFRYQDRLPVTMELVKTGDFNSAVRWCEAHVDLLRDGYGYSREASILWTLAMGTKLAKKGLRINCTMPSPTQTPMMAAFEKTSKVGVEVFSEPMGRYSTPEEQAYPLVFLNSDAAAFINGHNLPVDGGFIGGVNSGEIDVVARIAARSAVAG